MPWFRCEVCGCVENTALGHFWGRMQSEDFRALCSQCYSGCWHGRFPKKSAVGWYLASDGFIYSADALAHEYDRFRKRGTQLVHKIAPEVCRVSVSIRIPDFEPNTDDADDVYAQIDEFRGKLRDVVKALGRPEWQFDVI